MRLQKRLKQGLDNIELFERGILAMPYASVIESHDILD
jgi:hypothetical protein